MTRHDAALATVVCVGVAAVAVVVDAPVTAAAVGVGVGGSLLLEAALSARAPAVRRLWKRPLVQAAAVCVLAGGVTAAVFTDSRWLLTSLVAGLCTYLLMLAVVAVRRSAAP